MIIATRLASILRIQNSYFNNEEWNWIFTPENSFEVHQLLSFVEQNGHQSLNTLKFGKTNIHNTKNIIDIPNGNGSIHDKVTRHYGRIHPFTEGKRFREWIADLPFDKQYEEGIKVLEFYGWDGIEGIIR